MNGKSFGRGERLAERMNICAVLDKIVGSYQQNVLKIIKIFKLPLCFISLCFTWNQSSGVNENSNFLQA